MGLADCVQAQECRQDSLGLDERGTSFMTVMVIMLMTGSLGVAALTMSHPDCSGRSGSGCECGDSWSRDQWSAFRHA